ncbi:putative 60S acidic ribosomal protein [Naja naja]|nr:putative 60S acidic ribosomal protein [Naja naja]
MLPILSHGLHLRACLHLLRLILHDKVTVTEDKINALIKVAGVNVEPFWPGLFAKALTNIDIRSLICNVGVGGGEGTPVGGAAPAEEKKEEEKKEELGESDDNMGFDQDPVTQGIPDIYLENITDGNNRKHSDSTLAFQQGPHRNIKAKG